MDKILDIIKNMFQPKNKGKDISNVSFYDIDGELRAAFVRQYALSAFLLGGGIVLALYFKSASFFLLFFMLAAAFAALTTYRIVQCMEGNVLCAEGTCVEIYEHKLKVYERKYIIIESDDSKFIKVHVENPSRRGFKEGNTVKCYFHKNSIYTAADNTYNIISYYYCNSKRPAKQ